MSVLKEELEKLLELQTLDIKLLEINAQLKQIPDQIKMLEKEDALLKKELEEFDKTFTHLKVERRQKDSELKAIEQQIETLQSRLYEVKTNKEYQALQKEIENLKEKKSSHEDEIILLMEKEEQFREKEKQLQEKAEEYKKEKAKKQTELENAINQLKETRNLLEQQRQAYVSRIDGVILELYTRVRKAKKDGIAICKITKDSNGNICSGCYVYIPGHLTEKIKRKSEIVQCENCGRILTE